MGAYVHRGFLCAYARYRASAKPTAIGALRAVSGESARPPEAFPLTSRGSNLLLDVFRRFEHEVWPPEAFRADIIRAQIAKVGCEAATPAICARGFPPRAAHRTARGIRGLTA